jgi:hypothetical protein
VKKDSVNFINPVLAGVLVLVNMFYPKEQSFLAALGGSIWWFACGLVLGIVVIGLFMFFYNLSRPKNEIRISTPERITAGLICAIILSFLIK